MMIYLWKMMFYSYEITRGYHSHPDLPQSSNNSTHATPRCHYANGLWIPVALIFWWCLGGPEIVGRIKVIQNIFSVSSSLPSDHPKLTRCHHGYHISCFDSPCLHFEALGHGQNCHNFHRCGSLYPKLAGVMENPKIKWMTRGTPMT